MLVDEVEDVEEYDDSVFEDQAKDEATMMVAEYNQALTKAGGGALNLSSENLQLMEDVRRGALQKRWSELNSEEGHFTLRDAIIGEVSAKRL